MSKDLKTTVREFAASQSDMDLIFVVTRLADRFAGDLADALNFLGRNKSMDALLSGARSSEQFYDLLDQTTRIFQQEIDKRGLFA